MENFWFWAICAVVVATFAGFCFVVLSFTLGIKGLIKLQLSEIKSRLNDIVEGQRLSVILKLEPASLKISPEQFEPNKERLKTRMLQVLAEKKNRYADGDPGTYAFCVLNHSGWDGFINGDVASRAKNALARLLANGDEAAVKVFLEELVDKL